MHILLIFNIRLQVLLLFKTALAASLSVVFLLVLQEPQPRGLDELFCLGRRHALPRHHDDQRVVFAANSVDDLGRIVSHELGVKHLEGL